MLEDGDIHSRIVAWIKLISLLLSCGLWSSIFLFSKAIDPVNDVLITNVDLKGAERLGATNPIFAGVSKNDDKIKVIAEKTFPVQSNSQRYKGRALDAYIELMSGGLIHIISDFADIRMDRLEATLIENVVITTKSGYRLTTEKLDTQLDNISAESLGPIAGTGPIGKITSSRMFLTYDDATGDANLLFKGNVKVLYKPRIIED